MSTKLKTYGLLLVGLSLVSPQYSAHAAPSSWTRQLGEKIKSLFGKPAKLHSDTDQTRALEKPLYGRSASLEELAAHRDSLQIETASVMSDLRERIVSGKSFQSHGVASNVRLAMTHLIDPMVDLVLIEGKEGVGKSQVLYGIQQAVLGEKNTPAALMDATVIQIDSSVLEIKKEGLTTFLQKAFDHIEKSGAKGQVIFAFDRVAPFVSAADGSREDINLLLNFVNEAKNKFAGKKVSFILEGNSHSLKKVVSKANYFKNVKKVAVQQLSVAEQVALAKEIARKFSENANDPYFFTETVIDKVIELSQKYYGDVGAPRSIVNLMSAARRQRELLIKTLEYPFSSEYHTKIENLQNELRKLSYENVRSRSYARDRIPAIENEIAELQEKIKKAEKELENLRETAPKLARLVGLADSSVKSGKLTKETPSETELMSLLKSVKSVTEFDLATVISHERDISVSEILREERSADEVMEIFKGQVFGQSQIIETIRNIVDRAFDPLRVATDKRPVAVVLALGPPGVGKTETAKALSESGIGALLKIPVGELRQSHEVAGALKGAPPGYVGFDLHTDPKIIAHAGSFPRQVILLDEVDRGHPDIMQTLMNLFDEGELTASNGKVGKFHNAVFIATSNALQDVPGLASMSREEIEKLLIERHPEFYEKAVLNRFTAIVTYDNLDEIQLYSIFLKELKKFNGTLGSVLSRNIKVTDEAIRLFLNDAKARSGTLTGRDVTTRFQDLKVLLNRVVQGQSFRTSTGVETRLTVQNGDEIIVDVAVDESGKKSFTYSVRQ